MSPDISMCEGNRCEIKKTCYRFTAIPNEYQSYFKPTPAEKLPDKALDVLDYCEYYMSNKNRRNKE